MRGPADLAQFHGPRRNSTTTTIRTSMFSAISARQGRPRDSEALPDSGPMGKPRRASQMRKTLAKAVTWRLIGTAESFAISFWTTGHIATAGHTAGIAAITSIIMYVAHELAWGEHEAGGLGSRRPRVEPGRERGSPTTRPNRGRPCDVLRLPRFRLNRSTVVTASTGRGGGGGLGQR